MVKFLWAINRWNPWMPNHLKPSESKCEIDRESFFFIEFILSLPKRKLLTLILYDVIEL